MQNKIKRLSKSGLAIILSKLHAFENPKFSDEQYVTDSEVAATILWNAYLVGNIQGRVIADLGAGTGILGIGAGLLGAAKVYFVERDESAIVVLNENLEQVQKNHQKFKSETVSGDVKDFSTKVDTVFENPPFGVKKLHADRGFLEKAFEITDVVYSLHKSESTQFLRKFSANHGFEIMEEMKFSFPLKRTMKYHTSRVKRIDVSCYRFERK